MLSECIQAIVCQTLIRKASGGRVAAFELMLGTPAIRHAIRQDSVTHIESTMQTSGDVGMCTLDQYLQDLVSKRIISPAVARSTLLNRGGSFASLEPKK
jgi:twitching motility protein PilT